MEFPYDLNLTMMTMPVQRICGSEESREVPDRIVWGFGGINAELLVRRQADNHPWKTHDASMIMNVDDVVVGEVLEDETVLGSPPGGMHVGYEKEDGCIELAGSQVERNEDIGEVMIGVSGVAAGGENYGGETEIPGAIMGTGMVINYLDLEGSDFWHCATVKIAGVGFGDPTG